MKRLDDTEKVPFTTHLEELRFRLLFFLKVFALLFVVAYGFAEPLSRFFRMPIEVPLVFIAPAEAFMVDLKVAFWSAMFLGFPVLLYQLWQFISPGLLLKERKYAYSFLLCGSVLFYGGICFCFFVLLPFAIEFLLGFSGDGVSPMISIGSYLSFSLTLMFVFGIVFQLPLAVVLVVLSGMIELKTLKQGRGVAIILFFVFAAILTPPDVITQTMLALPMILLYEAGLFVCGRFLLFSEKEEVSDVRQ